MDEWTTRRESARADPSDFGPMIPMCAPGLPVATVSYMRRFGIAAGLVLTFLAGCASSTEGHPVGPSQDIVTSGEDPPATNAELPAPVATKKIHLIANIGDSISQAMDADDSMPVDVNMIATDPDAVFHDFPHLSWIQGTDPRIGSVASHYKELDPSLVVVPFSRSGAEMVSKPLNRPTMVDQATDLVAADLHPDLVFVLLGGNDICNRAKASGNLATANLFPVARWVEEIDKGLTILANGLDEGATVKVLSMPRVDRLYDSAGDARFTAKYSGLNTSLSCKQFWSATDMMNKGVCPIITTETDPARRAAIGERIDQYNDALAAEVRRFSSDRTLNPKGIVFQSDWHGAVGKGGEKDGSMGTFAFTADQVSKRDCFHPSVEGQAAVAKMVLETAKWE